MNKIYLALCSMLLAITTYAQEVTVRGKVTSNGEALPGVTVTVKGSKGGGRISSLDGSYAISVDAKGTLLFSFVGYDTQEIPVRGRSQINVVMRERATDLDEVVISVPYGVTKKSSFTGSAGVVEQKTIAASQVASVSKALQGSVAGLQSFSSSGQPGEDATILIRGVGSANASTTPLYVVDGVPYDGSLSSISSQDIEGITVLKDAAAAALYGSRAANGVIMITTKQGAKEAAPSIELTAKFGFSSRAVSDYKRLNTNDYFELQWEALRNGYLDQGTVETEAEANQMATEKLVSYLGINPYGSKNVNPVGTDGKLLSGLTPLWNDSWEDALTQGAHYTDLSARVSGGSKNTKYYFSLGYLDDQGAYIQSGFKRYTLRSNITSDLRKWLQVGLNISGTHSIQDYPKQDDTALSNVVLAARNLPSFYPVYERNLETGEYLYDESGKKIYDYGDYRTSSYTGYNFAQSMYYDKHNIKRDAASIRGYLQVTPIEGLSYKMSLNIDYNSKFTHDYSNPTYGKKPLTGSVSKYNYRTTGMTFNNVLNWEHSFDQVHNVHLMAGQEYYEYNTANFGGSRSGVVTDGYYEPDAASTLTGFSGNSDQYKLLSYFGSAEYNYAQRYFVSASVRSDGSSRFHPDNRWGTFWSVGGSWKINQEKFLEAASHSWLSNLSLRASYGAQGNDNVGYYAYQALYSIESFLGESALHASRLETPDLSWETNLNFNVGLDFGFFNHRLNGTIEYFERSSKDLLFSRDLIPSSGFSSIDANIGKVKNYGWELTLNGTPVMTKDWNWRLSLNLTTYKNEIVDIPTPEMWSGTKKWVKGGSLYDFWMYEWAGVNPENGKPQWYYTDKDGSRKVTEDYSSLTSSDKVKLGNALPKVSGGFQSDLSWKDLSLSVLFSYGIGGKIYNQDIITLKGLSGDADSWSSDMLKRWTKDNTQTDIPRLTTASSKYTAASSYWLVDRSYLRLKTMTLSYNLPKAWMNALTIKSANLFIQGENLLTFSKQQGLDPEQAMGGVTYFRYPAMKTFSFGINVKL